MHTYPFFSAAPKVLAHRGDSKFFPENTLPAFLSARDLGVDVIETDVHLTADNRLVIWHDDTLDRETNGKGDISNFTLRELMELDTGYRFSQDGGKTFPFRGKGISFLPLERALQELPEMRFNIDLKSRNPVIVQKFISCIRACGAENRIIGASFYTPILRKLRKAAPELATSFSTAEVFQLYLMHRLGLPPITRLLHGQALQIPEQFGILKVLTQGFIETFHKAGIYIHVWTINKEEDMHRLLDMGVDAIFTDDPRLLQRVIADREK